MNPICPNCATSNEATSRFCQGCGAMLTPSTAQGKTQVVPCQPQGPVARPLPPAAVAEPTCEPMGPSVAPSSYVPVVTQVLQQREWCFYVVDVSTSMRTPYDSAMPKLDAAKRAAATMALEKARLDDQDLIGLISFNAQASLVLPLSQLNTHKSEVLTAIQKLTVGGGTDINAGLKMARDCFEWGTTDVVRRIVLLTDGQGGHPLRTADDLKNRGVVIDTIGVGSDPCNVDETLLRKVASVIDGENRYRFIKDTATLVNLHRELAAKTSTGA
jgi:hypothetical protein